MDTSTVDVSPPAGKRWPVLGWIGAAFVSFVIFVVVQTVAGIVVLVKVHPEFLRVAAAPPPDFSRVLDGWTKDISAAPYLFLYALLGDGAMFACAVFYGKAMIGAGPSQIGLGRFGGFRSVWIGVLAGIGLIVASDITSAIQARIFGPHPEKVAELLLSHHGALSFVLDLLSVSVLAPLAEEYLFRGIVFNGLAQLMPVIPAAIVSGVVFGAAHLDPWSIVPLATIGVGLALLYRRTGSLWPNIVAHATVNTVALVAVYLFPKLAT